MYAIGSVHFGSVVHEGLRAPVDLQHQGPPAAREVLLAPHRERRARALPSGSIVYLPGRQALRLEVHAVLRVHAHVASHSPVSQSLPLLHVCLRLALRAHPAAAVGVGLAAVLRRVAARRQQAGAGAPVGLVGVGVVALLDPGLDEPVAAGRELARARARVGVDCRCRRRTSSSPSSTLLPQTGGGPPVLLEPSELSPLPSLDVPGSTGSTGPVVPDDVSVSDVAGDVVVVSYTPVLVGTGGSPVVVVDVAPPVVVSSSGPLTGAGPFPVASKLQARAAEEANENND
jgi:hypothetical protein